MIALLPFLKALVGNKFVWFGVALLAAVLWGRHERALRIEAHDRFVAFKAQTELEGQRAKARAAAIALADQRLKESVDAKHTEITAGLTARIAGLRRDASARGSGVPAAPAGSRDPSLACFDRGELSGAFDQLVGGLQKLVDEGDQSAMRLGLAKEWAEGLAAARR